jgi:hypothetical protein
MIGFVKVVRRIVGRGCGRDLDDTDIPFPPRRPPVRGDSEGDAAST